MKCKGGRREYGSTTSQVDITMNMLLAFIGMFILAFVAMRIKIEKSKKIDAKAEFMITVSWPKESGDDVDTYAEDPMGNLVFFRRREEGLMHLDRDDLGKRNDRVKDVFGNIIEIQENQEIVTIRGIIPGEYVVNTHMYRKTDGNPTKVKIHLQKLNPQVETIALTHSEFISTGEEITAFRFKINEEGDVTYVNEIEKPLAVNHISPTYGESSEFAIPEGENYE